MLFRSILESKAMFRSFDLWFEYFKTLVTATIPIYIYIYRMSFFFLFFLFLIPQKEDTELSVYKIS